MKNSFNPSIKKAWLHQASGFTLTELVVGMMITGVVLAIAGSGLIHLMSANNNSEKESERHIELNRALDYLSNDVRESRSASAVAPATWVDPTGYTAVFFLEKPFKAVDQATEDPLDEIDNVVGYYVKSPTPSEGWQSDQVIYRVYHDGTNYITSPVVDGLTNSPPGGCIGSGTLAGTKGFRVYIDGSKVKICLQGKSSLVDDPFLVESLVAIRNF